MMRIIHYVTRKSNITYVKVQNQAQNFYKNMNNIMNKKKIQALLTAFFLNYLQSLVILLILMMVSETSHQNVSNYVQFFIP